MKRCGQKFRQGLADLETVIWHHGWTVRETWPVLLAIARGDGTSHDEGLRSLGAVAAGLLAFAHQTGQAVQLSEDNRAKYIDDVSGLGVVFPHTKINRCHAGKRGNRCRSAAFVSAHTSNDFHPLYRR